MGKSSKSRWLVILLLAVLFSGWATTGVMIYIRLFFSLSLLLIGSFVWNKISLQGIHITRRSRSLRTSVGKVFDERFDIQNDSKLPCLWLEIENLSLLPQKSGSRLLTGIGGMQERSYTARTWVTRRGAFHLGPTRISSGDPFGIFVTNQTFQARDTLIVLPMTIEIPYFPTPAGILPGGKEIHHKTLDVTPHATGIREYIPGDPMKRIHWPSTAKRDLFMVKVYEQDPQAEIWFFLDSQSKMHYSRAGYEEEVQEDGLINYRRAPIKLPDDTYEYSISSTASLAKYFLKQSRAVGLVSLGNKLTIIPAERGERQSGKILETLAFLKADGNLPLVGCVNMQARFLPTGSGIILVSSSLNFSILMAVDDLLRRKLHPMVILIMVDSFGGPAGMDGIHEDLIARNVPVYTIQCGEPLERQLGQKAMEYQNKWTPS
jgi:uncharacterized protein (DUF58 family)